MPGVYFARRDGLAGRAGLTLPFTPTTGPIVLTANTQGYQEALQDEPLIFNGNAHAGVFTERVSYCAVLIMAELRNVGWTSIFFAHISGPDIDTSGCRRKFDEYCRNVNKATTFAAVLANDRLGARELSSQVTDGGILPSKLSVYVSCTSVTDIAYTIKGGYFGETYGGRIQGTQCDAYGLRGAVGAVDIY